MNKKDITGNAAPSGKRIKLADALPLETPLVVQIFDIYACNLACKFCSYGLPKEKRPVLSTKKVMDIRLYKKIIDDMTGFKNKIKLLRFCGAGESLLDKNIVEMIQYGMDKMVAERIELITNGILLTHEMSTAILNTGLSLIRISIYGVSAKTYKEMCCADVDFNKIVDNIRFFHKENIRLGKKTRIYIKSMDCVLNGPEEEAKFIELFGDYCDTYAIEKVRPNVAGIDYSQWIKDETLDSNALAIKLPPISVCPQPFHLITICPDGRVVPCSCESMTGVGNCSEDSIVDIWQGKALRQLQFLMLDGHKSVGGVCEDCNIVQCRPFPEDILDNYAEILKKKYENNI
ncbi:MAG: hypothetical protein A2099_08035 [Planctomycetes bacterium GWF2_39_10]|nr:MAG: hypothetical protein A2Y09_05235 [Planctomycetes bacterium GWA2_39_15]OHB46321.1 MAG: hypothetical protein A2099_08035 [Planctomycetes bacterium GWF2_39_10]